MIRVAIVDDHEIVREGLKTILQSDPEFEVVAESGTADMLTELAYKVSPDVVLLDARLPGVSGAEACKLLVASRPDIAVLIISAYSDQQVVEDCIRAGAKGYVVKNIERFSLKQSIRAVYAGEGTLSPAPTATLLAHFRGTAEEPTLSPSTSLNETQLKILRLAATGLSNREIANQIHLSPNTVKSHMHDIYRKLHVGGRLEATLMATQEGWL